ncbi:MAG: mammalian cell entry protein [Mycolicibacterium cosmeticum]|nr:mammalian cell entry protein [Mycolicibacterium cosmeticum]
MRGKLIALVVLVFALGLVGLSAVGGALYWDRVQSRAVQAATAELPTLATQQIPRVFGYDYQTVERSLTEAATMLTPDYRREFEDRAAKDIIPAARDRQVVSQANVVGAGMLNAQRDSASVLVFMNRTVTDKSKQPVYDGSRLRVDYQKVGGQWLIKYIQPV